MVYLGLFWQATKFTIYIGMSYPLCVIYGYDQGLESYAHKSTQTYVEKHQSMLYNMQ